MFCTRLPNAAEHHGQSLANPLKLKRRIPRQARAEETVSAILEGAAQVLEAGAAGGLHDQRRGRAGRRQHRHALSVSSRDKGALLRALAERRDEADDRGAWRKALRGEDGAPLEERVRAVVRPSSTPSTAASAPARRWQAVLAQGLAIEMVAPVAAFIADAGPPPTAASRA